MTRHAYCPCFVLLELNLLCKIGEYYSVPSTISMFSPLGCVCFDRLLIPGQSCGGSKAYPENTGYEEYTLDRTPVHHSQTGKYFKILEITVKLWLYTTVLLNAPFWLDKMCWTAALRAMQATRYTVYSWIYSILICYHFLSMKNPPHKWIFLNTCNCWYGKTFCEEFKHFPTQGSFQDGGLCGFSVSSQAVFFGFFCLIVAYSL